MKSKSLVVCLSSILFLVLTLFAPPALADDSTTVVMRHVCPGGTPLWLWVTRDGGASCSQDGDEFFCTNSTGDDAQANCSIGCTRVVIGNIAGCYFGDGSPNVFQPNHTITCSNGRKFDLKGREGDECETETDVSGNVTGGNCHKKDDPDDISTSANCQTGCEYSQPPADCTER